MKQLPVGTKYFFDQFIHAANKQVLHPFDWKRFYDFIYIAHKGRTKLSEGELLELLEDVGFDSEQREKLADVYQHGRSLLKRKPNPTYIRLKAGVKT